MSDDKKRPLVDESSYDFAKGWVQAMSVVYDADPPEDEVWSLAVEVQRCVEDWLEANGYDR